MKIGVPRERKDMEFRVGIVPDGVGQLRAAGHEVLIERDAGIGSGFGDDDYVRAGARIVDAEEAWSSPELVVKVKEPLRDEIGMLRSGQTLFTYLHLAAAPELTEALLGLDITAIAYETIQNPDGSFPVLSPMSEVAGRLAVQIGVTLLLLSVPARLRTPSTISATSRPFWPAFPASRPWSISATRSS